jgi:hypothetical protein
MSHSRHATLLFKRIVWEGVGSGGRTTGDVPRPPDKVSDSHVPIGRKVTADEGKWAGCSAFIG